MENGCRFSSKRDEAHDEATKYHILKDLSTTETSLVRDMLGRYSDIFSLDDGIGKCATDGRSSAVRFYLKNRSKVTY